MKYRVFALLGLLAFSAGSLIQAQDYDDIYYDASKSESAIKAKVEQQKPKTVAVYGNVPEKYKVAVKDNYRLERDVDEYNRRGNYEPDYEVDINGDTIYFNSDSIYVDAFSNTRMIERFYNPDVVILSDDDDLIELYYDESPTINLIVGNDWNYAPYGWSASYYPWYTGWYEPWYASYHVPYWGYGGWYSPYRYWGWGWDWYYSYWGWPRNPWYWHTGYWGWGHNHWAWGGHHGGHHGGWRPDNNYDGRYLGHNSRPGSVRAGLAGNRNTNGRVSAGTANRNGGISGHGAPASNRGNMGNMGSRSRSGYASSRSGNMGSRGNGGVTTRNSGYSPRSSSGSSYGSGYRSSGGSSSSRSYGGSRSSSSSYGGSSHSSGSYSGGGSHSSGGSHGGSGGTSGGGGRRR